MKGTYGGKRREGNGNSNNGINRNPNANTSSGVFYETEETTKNFNDRLNYLLATSISTEATVTVTTGVKYSGILAACNPEGSNGVDVVLKFPKVIDKGFATSNIDQLASDLKENLVIKGEDVAELQLHDVNFSGEGKVGKEAKEESGQKAEVKAEFKPSSKLAGPATERKIKAEFKTDTDISGANTVIKERELEKWVPDDHETFDMNESLEDSTTSWNQFAVNEEKFGVTSTFDEHLYTTRINKDDPNYLHRLKEADRIAKEIESQGASGNVHLAEERGIIVDDSGIDEEDKYSGVDRRGDELLAALKLNAKSNPPKAKKYVPPTLRSQPHNADPAIISSKAAVISPQTVHPKEHKNQELAPEGGHSHSRKKNQLDELKEFSEKFKVPYEMPEEVKAMLKKSSENSPKAPQAALKVNPSLPPKPTSTPPTNPNSSASSKNARATRDLTPSANKAELRKPPARMSQGHTPVHSPSSGRHANISRRRNISQGSFFGSKGPLANKKDFSKNFNMFIKGKEAFEQNRAAGKPKGGAASVFVIEKPYFTAPTWFSNVEQSYRTMFPDEHTAIQRSQMKMQQRSMSAMSSPGSPHMMGVPGMMMGMPMGPSGSPNPYMMAPSASANMYMPFQPPAFYPPVMQMMPMGDERGGSGTPPPQNTGSPLGGPTFMNAGPGGPIPPFNYSAAAPFQPVMGSRSFRQGFQNQSYQNHHNRHRAHDR